MTLEDADYSYAIAAVGYFAACILGAVAFLIILYLFGRTVLRLFKSVFLTFGSDLQQRLISVGLVCLLFQSALVQVIQIIIESLRALLTVPTDLLNGWSAASHTLRARQWDIFAGEAANAIVQSWTRGLTQVLHQFEPLPIVTLLLMVGLGAAFGEVTKYVGRASEMSRSVQERQFSVRVHNFVFFVILVLAVYLSIGAVAAISVLQNPTTVTEEVSAAKLRELLENDRQAFENSIGDSSAKTSPLAGLEKALGKDSESAIRGLQSFVDIWHIEVDQPLAMYSDYISALKKKRTDNISLAITNYQVENMDRKGGRESAQYFLDLSNWYRDSLAAMSRAITKVNDDRILYENLWNSLARSLVDEVNAQNVGETAQSRIDRINKAFNAGAASNSTALSAAYAEIPFYEDPVLPDRRTLGSGLGIFSLLASWILRTESMPLALIVE